MNIEELLKNLWLMSLYCKNSIFRQTAKEAMKIIENYKDK